MLECKPYGTWSLFPTIKLVPNNFICVTGKELNAGNAHSAVKMCMCTLNKISLKKKKGFFQSFRFIEGCLENCFLGLVHNADMVPIRGRPTASRHLETQVRAYSGPNSSSTGFLTFTSLSATSVRRNLFRHIRFLASSFFHPDQTELQFPLD